MVQTQQRPQAQHPTQAAHQTPAKDPAPATTPAPAPQRMPVMALVTDRQLIEQLRQIYQAANRHLPVPKSTELSKSLTDTLDEIAEIAEKAVEGYKP